MSEERTRNVRRFHLAHANDEPLKSYTLCSQLGWSQNKRNGHYSFRRTHKMKINYVKRQMLKAEFTKNFAGAGYGI